MNALTKTSICAGCVFLIGATQAAADPVCVVGADVTTPAQQDQGLAVCSVYAQFDGLTEQDVLLSVGLSDIATNNLFGFVDGYVTVGAEPSNTMINPSFDMGTPGQILGGWFNAHPVGAPASPDSDLQVQIAQVTVLEGTTLSGAVRLFYGSGYTSAPFEFECFAPSDCSQSSAPVAMRAGFGFEELCRPDLNPDGQVDSYDLAILLGSWGSCPGCPADLNDDGVVDALDREMLLDAWGVLQETVDLTSSAQGNQCVGSAPGLRPLADDGSNASVLMTARTKIDRNSPTDSNASGMAGTVRISANGAGVSRGNCSGSRGISGERSDQDEELIFTFDEPVPCDTIILGLNKIDFNKAEPVIFITADGGAQFMIDEAEIFPAFTSTGASRGTVDFGEFTSVASDVAVVEFKIRETNKHIYVDQLLYGCP